MKAHLVALLLGAASLAQADMWHFGLIGDVPYSNYERRELPHMLEAMADSHVDVIAHIGDIKHGGDRCDDSLFQDRYQLFNGSRVPFVFIPGDNEWTDCDRLSNGAYDPLERLSKLRSLFWKDAMSLGQRKLPLEVAPDPYREHARFRLGPVLFVTVNLPGDTNNYGKAPLPNAEFLARNPAVLSWLKESFAVARRERRRGIVLLFQANPEFKHFAQGFPHRGFRGFLETLRDETLRFDGQVVVVHGDTHHNRIDHPLRDREGKPLRRFTRIETFGYPVMGWTRGTIDTDDPALFRFENHPWPTKAQ